MAATIIGDADGYKIEKGHQGVYNDLVHWIGMHDRNLTLGQAMERFAALDIPLDKLQSRSGTSANTTPTMKASAWKMDPKKGGTIGTAGTAKDDGLTG